MAEQELWTELLKQMHRRYGAVNEVFRVTKEIADALSRDDRVAAQMLLGMRQEENLKRKYSSLRKQRLRLKLRL